MEIVFETYAEVLDFLNDRSHLDTFVIKSTKDFIANPELDVAEMDIRCEELGKIFKINYNRSQVKDVLTTVMEKLSELERYETCIEVRDLLNKI